MMAGGRGVIMKYLSSKLLSACVVSNLDSEDYQEIERHSDECDICGAEFDDLSEIEAAPDGLPAGLFLEDPSGGGDLLLRQILNRVHIEKVAAARRRVFTVGVLAAALAGVMFVGGYVAASRVGTDR